MPAIRPHNAARRATPHGFLHKLSQDTSGNTLAIVAAATIPTLALVGGGIDMGRGYLAQSRLQQACDAGALAARQKLGSNVAAGGVLPADAAAVGKRFFDTNFVDGQFGTTDRAFRLSLESDYSVKGEASVEVPATVMRALGFEKSDIAVECMAKLNFSNTDVMMVLDTTASMEETLPGDKVSKISALRQVVKDFYAELEKNKPSGIRIRYGFLPYAENVNVGGLLKPEWIVDKWNYEGRTPVPDPSSPTEDVTTKTTEQLTPTPPTTGPTISDTCPSSNVSWFVKRVLSDTINAQGQRVLVQLAGASGKAYQCSSRGDGKFATMTTDWTGYEYKETYTFIGTTQRKIWQYRPIEIDLAFIKNGKLSGANTKLKMEGSPSAPTDMTANYYGCVEERSTYNFGASRTPDLSRALDLDLDLVPTNGVPATQWRPMLHEVSFIRSVVDHQKGQFTPEPVTTTAAIAQVGHPSVNLSVCPNPARALSTDAVGSYVDGLKLGGNTYHDIGMIWGGRLISANGLFKDRNADINGQPTSRHLIFLTDGVTRPDWHTYGAYGIEPLSQRRTTFSGNRNAFQTLVPTVENRFGIACDEVKKRNITVWVIGFGITMTDMLKECAGDGRWFQANDAKELNDVFKNIASSMGDLRISK